MSYVVNTIVICGAGTMGSGIAQVVAQTGFYSVLFDVNNAILMKAQSSIETNLETLEGKKKISTEEKEKTISRLQYVNDINYCLGDVVIEAIVENTEAKAVLFNQLAELNHAETIFATNTSSLSVTDIAAKVVHPERICGMHFFNPATIMKLVEIVKAEQTKEEVVQTICGVARQMKKIPVICKDAPGFIVNRVARHYYLEALKLVEEGICSFEQIDLLMVAAGFKMGPFRLMDLIGNDVNLAVTQSLYEAYDRPDRFKPSPIQEEKVKKGELGRKTGKGYYEYE